MDFFTPMTEGHPFYFNDLIDISKQERTNPREMQRRIQVLMSGDEQKKVKPFYRQDSEILVFWLSSLRMEHHRRALEARGIDHFPLWKCLFQNRFHVHLLKLMTHSYRTSRAALAEIDQAAAAAEVCYFGRTRKDDDQDGDYHFYPAYAAEVLSMLITVASPQQLKTMLNDLFVDHAGYRILALCLKYGVCLVRYFVSHMITMLNMRTAQTYESNIDEHKIVDALVHVALLPKDTFEKELETDRGAYQIDVLKRFQNSDGYAPRYMEHVFEAVSMALLLCLTNPFKRTYYVQERFDLVQQLIELADVQPVEAHPDNDTQCNYLSILACLCHIDNTNEETLKDTVNELARFDTDDTIEKLVRIYAHLRNIDDPMEHAAKKLKNVMKYKPDAPPTESTLMEAIMTALKSETAILDILASLSHVPSLATKILQVDDQYILRAVRDLLFQSTKHDQLWSEVSTVDMVTVDNIISPVNPTTNMQRRIIHYSPHLSGAAALLLKNLVKSCHAELSIAIDDTRLNDSILKNINQLKDYTTKLVKKGEYDDAREYYAVCLRMLSGLEESSQAARDLCVILYSNRAEMNLQLKDSTAALHDVQEALKLDPVHEKSLRRYDRAVALQKREA